LACGGELGQGGADCLMGRITELIISAIGFILYNIKLVILVSLYKKTPFGLFSDVYDQ
jgi:hypothetical protein